ncbi:MAG: adenylate kinase [Saprospiraceae bacterium]|nr:adenylate kinase [Bacteroidia bacterium]NNL92278.1 adenylate kinase [Saprospiraceae bacterium]
MINLILFGPPGSGKGTQAKTIVEKFDLTHISTGDLFRHEIGNKTPLGIKAKKYMDDGLLVPDEVTIGMLENKLDNSNNPNGYILDGFPRTIAQASALDAMLKERGTKVTHLIALDVDDNEIVKRIMERGKTSGRADDRNEEIVRQRIEQYNELTSPVYGHYDKFGISKKVDGIGEIDEIFNRIYDALTVPVCDSQECN